MIERDLTLPRPVRITSIGAAGHKIAAGVLGLAAALILGEILLWLVLPSQARYYVWPPNFKATLYPNPEYLPGVSGASHFNTNSFGIRGKEFAEGQSYRILAVGGSTTECLYLDENEVWTNLLERQLTEAKGKPIWVGNVGRSGRNTRHHILQLKYLLPQYPKVDAVILLAGVNDLHIKISDLEYDSQTTARASFEQDYMRASFALSPPDLPFYHYKKLGWWRMAKQLKSAYLSDAKAQPILDATGKTTEQWRRFRKHAEEVVDAMPDLTAALDEYSRNLHAIADLAQARAVRLILVTQPTLWRPGMKQEDTELLWMGGIGSFQTGKGHKYYSVSSLDAIMRRYNETLLDVCKKRLLDCVDMAGLLPKDRTVFYDDVHFNESGARQVAGVLYRHLNSMIP